MRVALAAALVGLTGTLSAQAATLNEHQAALESTWEAELGSSSKERPVQRVVRLLNEMKVSIEKEAKQDEDIFEKQACWCETNKADKTTSISDAESHISNVVSDIQQRAGRSAELKSNLKHQSKNIAADEAALDQAETIRGKDLTEFRGSEKDMVLAIANLRNAIQVLSKHHTSLLQSGVELFAGLGSVLKQTSDMYEEVIGSTQPGETRHQIFSALQQIVQQSGHGAAFLQAGSQEAARASAAVSAARHSTMPPKFASELLTSFLQGAPTNSGSYSSQSSVIFGILGHMKTDFEKKLKQLQDEEATSVSDYADLKSIKSAGLASMKQQVDDMSSELATSDKKLTDAKQDLAETRESLAADRKFLSDINLQCQQGDKDFELRQRTRSEELKAVSEAISIITNDEAKDTFNRNFSFLQESASTGKQQALRQAAVAVLKKARTSTQQVWDSAEDVLADSMAASLLDTAHPDISALETTVQLDAFTKVKEAIDQMLVELKKQQGTEVEQKDWCNGQFDENSQESQKKKHEHEDVSNHISDLEMTIKTTTEAIESLRSEISEMNVQMKKAGEQREAANLEFQAAVSDQRATQHILKQALAKLTAFYKKQQPVDQDALVQEPGKAPVAMPKSQAYKSNEGSSSVLSMLEMIIGESATAEKEAMDSEKQAQATYEEFILNSNAGIKAKSAEVITKSEAVAGARSDKEAASGDLLAVEGVQAKLTDYNAQLHSQCDYLMKNFDLRQNARTQEMEALAQAKSILSGASAQ